MTDAMVFPLTGASWSATRPQAPSPRCCMVVDGESHRVAAGVTVVATAGSSRGMEAITRLAFLGVRVGAEPAG